MQVPGGRDSPELPTCACILIKAPGCEHPWTEHPWIAKGASGTVAVRPYTPISPRGMNGKFQLLIKRYREWGTPPTENEGYALHRSYRPPGAVSSYMHNLEPGVDAVQFSH